MGESDISFQTDDEVFTDAEYTGNSIASSLPSRWSDINVEDIEISAKKISSCVTTNGLLSTLEHCPTDRPALTHIEDRQDRNTAVIFGKYSGDNPATFIQDNLKNMDMNELLSIREDLMKESLNHRDHLKKFVKENFQSCINNMDTIREVATRLRAASLEGGVGVHGATPAKVLEELHNLDYQAENNFSGLIKRYNLSQNLDSVLQLLGKYDSLVILPSMVRSSVEGRDFEAVVTLYQKAMNLVEKESLDTGEVQTIWKRLQVEVSKAMESAVTILEATLRSSTVSMVESYEAACYLEKLQSMGVPAASGKSSLNDFFECQVTKIIGNMEKTREYTKSLDQGQIKEKKESQYQYLAQPSSRMKGSFSSHDQLCIQTLTADYYEWCYELWSLYNSSSNRDQSIHILREKGKDAETKVIERAFSAYSGIVESCIAGICSSFDDTKESHAVVKFLIESCLEVDDTMLDLLLPLCKDMVIHICQQILLGLESHLRLIAQDIFLVKGRCLDGFLPREHIALLHQSIDESMLCISKLSKHASRIKLRVPLASRPVNNILKLASEVCSEAISKLASRRPVLTVEGEEINEYVLLIAWNTLEKIKTAVLPQVATKWSFLLNSGGATPKDNAEAFKWCCSQIEDSQEYLIRSWVEIKLEKLEPVMETLLTLEESENMKDCEQPLIKLFMSNPCVWDLLTALNSYDADIQNMIPILREEVTGEMHLAVLEGMQNLVQSEQFKKANLQSKAQLWLDLTTFHSWLIRSEIKENRIDNESTLLAQTIISRLEENIRSHMQKIPGNHQQITEVKQCIASICSRDFPEDL